LSKGPTTGRRPRPKSISPMPIILRPTGGAGSAMTWSRPTGAATSGMC
jgi:hypothetical protein